MLSFVRSKAFLLPAVALTLSGAACNKGEQSSSSASEFKSDTEKVSYILGFKYGEGLRKQSVDVDTAMFAKGVEHGNKDPKKYTITQEEEQKTLQAFRKTLDDKRTKERQEKAAKNTAAGEKFMAENKTKPGVVELPSGVQYKILQAGTGEKPLEDSTVNVNYKGTLLDGTVFDSNESAALNLKYVVPGFAEAVKMMPVGSKWEIVIPGKLAYGDREAGGGKIGPSETLKFEIELKSINKPEKQASAETPKKPQTTPKGTKNKT